MKRIIASLLTTLLAGCLLPVLFYYGMFLLLTKDPATALHTFAADLQGQTGASAAPPAAQPQPAAPSPAPEATVPIWDSGAQRLLEVSLREYVIGAVASEMPINWPDAALQAQAGAAHTYLLYRRDHTDPAALHGAWLTADPARRRGFLTDAGLRSYWGPHYAENYARLAALVDPVLQTILTWEQEPAAASYFALSNGRTEASQNVWNEALPYLQGVDSSWDQSAEGYARTVRLSSTQMHSALVTALEIRPDGCLPADYFTDFIYTDAGYVYTVQVCGQEVLGTVLRSALDLRSSCFAIQWDGTDFVITTYGYGHGVGLSQTGARAMAENGSSWQEILLHYFPGTELTIV